ncbi:MAG TPA: sterol desaturase family protein, partial [Thermoanaerobaculia bacterium]|nr:sterol desaturase family protein [Thermoanaerobaculia bacterium]
MTLIAELMSYALLRLSRLTLTQKGVTDALTFVAVLLFCLALEGVKRHSVRRYGSKGFRTDVLYSLVYLSGAYSIFVGLPVYRFLMTHLSHWVPFLQTHILIGLPAPVQFLAGLAAADFTYYLWHRSVHATPFLWAFHSIHHSQQELTIATSLRVHIFEEMVRGIFYFVPFFILAIPAHVWLPLDIAINWLLFLEHSDLDWTYGKLGRFIVSPHFHRIHHSVETQDLDTNFGSFLSIWDRIFGTANARAT